MISLESRRVLHDAPLPPPGDPLPWTDTAAAGNKPRSIDEARNKLSYRPARRAAA